MAKSEEKSTALKKSWTQELKGEFKKITWLDRTTLLKQSAVVIVSTVILGAIIAVVDWLIQILRKQLKTENYRTRY